jgi:hypothetical protein
MKLIKAIVVLACSLSALPLIAFGPLDTYVLLASAVPHVRKKNVDELIKDAKKIKNMSCKDFESFVPLSGKAVDKDFVQEACRLNFEDLKELTIDRYYAEGPSWWRKITGIHEKPLKAILAHEETLEEKIEECMRNSSI